VRQRLSLPLGVQRFPPSVPPHCAFPELLLANKPRRYSTLIPKLAGEDEKAKCNQILTQSLKSTEFAIGKTKIFLAMGAQFKLDLMVDAVQRQAAGAAAQGTLVDSIVQRTKTAWNWLFS